MCKKPSLAQMLENAECASIIQVIGAGSGKSFDINDARYGRVILMSDADVDGAHIRCLLLTSF
jgi:DNA gyrase subunit B